MELSHHLQTFFRDVTMLTSTADRVLGTMLGTAALFRNGVSVDEQWSLFFLVRAC